MKEITDYEIIEHGFEYPDYFQGCGTDGYDNVVTGIGDNPQEALEDCIEQIAQSGDYDLTQLETEVGKMPIEPCASDTYMDTYIDDVDPDNDCPYYYVSVRWND